ncbi:MAG: hemerythrin domain-containing protein [Sphingomonadales bacterium]|nr:hemerythrin domain-containing protein [Sphingomonadales bacterium]
MELEFFKAEHEALLDLSRRLLAALKEPADPALAHELRGAMNRILVGHLAKEDRHIYQQLRQHEDTAKITARFEEELGGLAPIWDLLMSDWPQERIAAEWQAFGAAVRQVLALLAERARREEEELYPLLVRRWSDVA